MRTVQSTNIAAIGFDPNPDENEPDAAMTGALTVRFKNGRTYKYADVPEATYEALLTEATRIEGNPDAENGGGSVGRLFTRLVRQAGFDFEEVEG